jgi:maltose alpha-D-glucosyltransferase/alpha-amylase
LEAAPAIPDSCQWATFLRNHDEVDLGRLSERERAECFAAFGPEEDMQLYGRGIRRRLAPMLGNDRRRIEMAYSLQFTLPGTPVLRYGEEIGMGDDLSLKDRDAIRTPMQWAAGANAGFSTAPAKKLCRPVIRAGDFGYESVSVEAQRRDPGSLLHWMERMLHTLRECPEFAVGACAPVDTGDPAVLALHYEAPGGVMLALHNLSDRRRTVDLGAQPGQEGDPVEMFGDRDYAPVTAELKGVELAGYGYRWLRLRETPGR